MLPKHLLGQKVKVVGQDEGEHLNHEALLAYRMDAPGKHGVKHTAYRLHHPLDVSHKVARKLAPRGLLPRQGNALRMSKELRS